MTSKSPWIFHLAIAVSSVAVPSAAHADFFDDARKTFTTDIPHFFQDDIPCAFGGQPTSHTKATCSDKPERPAPVVTKPAPDPNRPADPPPVAGPPRQ